MAMLDTNLASLEPCSYSPRVSTFHLVDTFGRDDMSNAFTDVPPLPPPNEFPASIPDVAPAPPPDEAFDPAP